MTYRELINKYITNKSIDIDAIYFLIQEVCEINRSTLILKMDENLEENVLTILQEKVNLYVEKNIPVQYIMGYTYFYNDKFIVNSDVLIPRFDTEVLVDEAIKEIKNKGFNKIVDVGCGSGCIAISIKKVLKDIDIYAIDISKKALDVAKHNAKIHNTEITFIENDLLNYLTLKVDMIISNPPYIDREEEVDSIVKNNEPHLALFSENKGLYHYEEILKQSKDILNDEGMIIFEVPAFKDRELLELFHKYYDDIEIIKDYNHLSRVAKIKKRKDK